MKEEYLIIEKNIRLFKPLAYKVPVFELLDSKGNKTGNYSKGNEIARILSDKELITIDERMCYLTEKGKDLKFEIQDLPLQKSLAIVKIINSSPITKPIEKIPMFSIIFRWSCKYWWTLVIPTISAIVANIWSKYF